MLNFIGLTLSLYSLTFSINFFSASYFLCLSLSFPLFSLSLFPFLRMCGWVGVSLSKQVFCLHVTSFFSPYFLCHSLSHCISEFPFISTSLSFILCLSSCLIINNSMHIFLCFSATLCASLFYSIQPLSQSTHTH